MCCVLQEEIARLKAELLARQQAGAGGEATTGSGEVSSDPCTGCFLPCSVTVTHAGLRHRGRQPSAWQAERHS
jgi:hypothetical protein